MAYSGENLRVGNEGAHFDQVAEEARARSSAIQTARDAFLATLRMGFDIRPDPNRPETVSDCLGAPEEPELRRLFDACSLTLLGRYEAGAKALLDFINSTARRYGERSAHDSE